VYHVVMRRIQLHLEEALDEALAREAARRHQSKAQLMRDYLWRQIDLSGTVEDSLDELAGISDAPVVAGETIDDVVYG
jgi:Ribbon-helix-helix protein, copG family